LELGKIKKVEQKFEEKKLPFFGLKDFGEWATRELSSFLMCLVIKSHGKEQDGSFGGFHRVIHS